MNSKQEIKQKMAKLNEILKDPTRVVIGAFGSCETCGGLVESIIEPEEGGIFTKFYGCNYLYKGRVDNKSVGGVTFAKRMVSRIAMAASEKPVMMMLVAALLVYLIFPRKTKQRVTEHLIALGTDLMYEPIKNITLEEKRYCPAARELRRTIIKIFESPDPLVMATVIKIGEIVAGPLQHDYAYRSRWQDIIPEIDLEALRKNPGKELKRLFTTLEERGVSVGLDGGGKLVQKWRGFSALISLACRLKSIREMIIKFFEELDLEKIKPDEDDWYFMLDRPDYNYGGLPYAERMEISAELDKKMKNNRPRFALHMEKDDKIRIDFV